MIQEKLQRLRLLLNELQGIFAVDADVHKYTKRLGDICREFLAVDNQYVKSLSGSSKIEVVINQILATCPEDLRANVGTVLNSIKSFAGADAETGLALQELLMRVWSLRTVYANGVDLVYDNLNHNIATGGGCFPGIAARLVQPYTAFLIHRLESLQDGMQDEWQDALLFSTAAQQEEDDEELALSIERSLQFR